MNATPLKERTAVRENPACPARTIANELPQELSRLAERYVFFDVPSLPTRDEATTPRSRRGKASHSKKAASVAKARQLTVTSTSGFVDAGHPTIFAAALG